MRVSVPTRAQFTLPVVACCMIADVPPLKAAPMSMEPAIGPTPGTNIRATPPAIIRPPTT
jgi:hypothetical protein